LLNKTIEGVFKDTEEILILKEMREQAENAQSGTNNQDETIDFL